MSTTRRQAIKTVASTILASSFLGEWALRAQTPASTTSTPLQPTPTVSRSSIKKIKGMTRLEETVTRLGGVGDNWHMSWAANDKQYVGLCDGSGWKDVAGYTGKDYNSRMFAIEGIPPRPVFEYLPGYPDLVNTAPPNIYRYYGFGILALDKNLYHFLSTPNHILSGPEARFVGAKLIWSPDEGKTWKNQDGSSPVKWEPFEERNRQNMIFFNEDGDAFSLLTVLQMGQNYEFNKDGFVYIYSPNGNVDGKMNQLALCRVPKEKILDRSAYEFFAQRLANGDAQWVKNLADRGVVHEFPLGWVNHTRQSHPYGWQPSVVYYPACDCYLMANWGMGINAAGDWFAKPSYLGFWTSPAPWGPWTQVHEETAWMPAGDPGARCYQPQISPKWIAADGKSFWLVWTDFQTTKQGRSYYAFNLQKVDVLLE